MSLLSVCTYTYVMSCHHFYVLKLCTCVRFCIWFPIQLEQMELEVTDLQPPLKTKLASRVRSYKNELLRLQREFVSSYTSYRYVLFVQASPFSCMQLE